VRHPAHADNRKHEPENERRFHVSKSRLGFSHKEGRGAVLRQLTSATKHCKTTRDRAHLRRRTSGRRERGRQQPAAIWATVDRARATQTHNFHQPVRTCRHGLDLTKTPRFGWSKLASDNSSPAFWQSQIKKGKFEDQTTPFASGSMSFWCLARLPMWLHRPSAKLKPSQVTRVHR